MSDLKVQGVVEMSSEGAERAFDRVGQKADDMARKVVQTSGQAGQAVDQIGTGASRSADEFTRAEGRIVSSIKRATNELQNLGKTASQRLELRIDDRGLDRAKFEPLLAKLRELEAAQTRVAASGRGFGGQLQNTSYQLQDFIVQVNGGTDAMRALSMQLPQMLIGFGAAGAAIGVVAALLPNVISLFGDAGKEAESLKDAMSGMDDAISQVGRTVRAFDMEGLYEQFNKSTGAVQAATIEQLKFQQAFIETQRLTASKAFGESVAGLGQYGTLDRLAGAFGNSPVQNLAEELGVTLEVAQQLAPVLKGLREGTEDVGLAFNQFGSKLLGGNKAAIDLATSMRDLANGEKDAYAASSALSEALERMAKGHVTTKKEADEAAKSSKAYADEMARLAQAGNDLVQSLIGQSSGLSSDFYKKWETLAAAYQAGAISLQDLTGAQASLLAQQPAMKQAAKDAEDYGKALGASVGALEDRALAVEQELATYGLTKSQIERTTIARLEEARAMAAANGASDEYLRNLDREIAARKRIAEATAGIEVEDANKKAAEKAAQEWERTANAIEDKLIDALMEGGKSGREYIEGLFRTMVLRPIVQAIVSPVAGGLTSAMGFGAPSSSSGGFSGYGSLANTALGPLGGIAGAISGLSSLAAGTSLGSFGAGLASGFASFGSLGSSAATFSAGLSTGGAVGSGMAIGTALPYVGAALGIASALGAFDGPSYHSGAAIYTDTNDLSKALGHKSSVPGMSGGIWGGFTETDAKGGSAFSGALSQLGASLTSTYEQALAQFGIQASAAALTAFGADGKDASRGNFRLYDESGALITTNGGLDRRGKKYAKDAQQGMQQYAEDAALATARAIVTRLQGTDLEDAVDAIFDAINPAAASLDQLNAAIAKAQAWIAQGEQLRAAISETFDSPAERLNAAFAKLGAGIPQTIEAYEALVRAQRLDTVAGRERATLLLQAKGLWDEVQQEALRAAEESKRAAERTAEAWKRAADTLKQTIAGLRGDTSGGSSLSLRAQYDRAYTMALSTTGDARAGYAQQMAGLLPGLVTALRDDARSRIEWQRSVAQALAKGDRIAGFATGGYHSGGLRIVGETGPEIEATGPAMYWSATQTASMLGGQGTADEIRALRDENRAQARAMMQMQARMTKLFERWDGAGLPETRVVA